MPKVDMPLEELKKYAGVSPKPHDFEDYWNRALKDLDAQSLQYELIPADFKAPNVECYHLYFTGVGNAQIHARFIKPAKISAKIPAVAYFHGYKGHCGDWFGKLPYAMSGICTAMLDVRGQAGLSEDNSTAIGNSIEGQIIRGVQEKNPDKLFFRNIFLDTAQLVRILKSMDFVDSQKIGAAGFSQGGALTLACAALEQSVKVACAGYPFLIDYKRVWDMDLAKNAYNEISRHFRLCDPTHKEENAFWNRLGYIDLQYLVPRIKAKTVFYTGLMDEVCPPSTQFAAYNKITAQKSMILYPEYAHENLPDANEHVYKTMLENL